MVLLNSEALNATLPLMKETTIIGNYMQQDMHVLYDLDKGVLSFQTADCSDGRANLRVAVQLWMHDIYTLYVRYG
ncbi:aspartic proteinase nepenthesin-1-like [Panicum miliaceum]|uniref:Aspartic proteinase nepenthesin-1-like n=1 Tax=Panicum miliaceum TaxID=4540 RepID=A0A3L6RYX8_PANMI|nr:aspartic proteinase nepenthesin-1-like [Panicum miliaceum]